MGLALSEDRGSLKVAKVWADSPAELAGIGPEDELIAVNGRRVRDVKGWKAALQSAPAGKEMRLTAACEGTLYEAALVPERKRHFHLAETDNPTPEQEKKLEKWLGRR